MYNLTKDKIGNNGKERIVPELSWKNIFLFNEMKTFIKIKSRLQMIG